MNRLVLVAPGNERDTEQFLEQICGPAITCQGKGDTQRRCKAGSEQSPRIGNSFSDQNLTASHPVWIITFLPLHRPYPVYLPRDRLLSRRVRVPCS